MTDWKKYYDKEKHRISQLKWISKKENRWLRHFYGAKARCENKMLPFYKHYGGRGIKFLFSKVDFKSLWLRDKAWLLKRPSIDRINNDGDYEMGNCRFVELSENVKKEHINHPKKSKIVVNSLGQSFPSLAEAGRVVGILHTSIANCLKGRTKTAGGLKWQYQ